MTRGRISGAKKLSQGRNQQQRYLFQQAGAGHTGSTGGTGCIGISVQGGARHGQLLQGAGSCRGLTSHQAPSVQLKGGIKTGT